MSLPRLSTFGCISTSGSLGSSLNTSSDRVLILSQGSLLHLQFALLESFSLGCTKIHQLVSSTAWP